MDSFLRFFFLSFFLFIKRKLFVKTWRMHMSRRKGACWAGPCPISARWQCGPNCLGDRFAWAGLHADLRNIPYFRGAPRKTRPLAFSLSRCFLPKSSNPSSSRRDEDALPSGGERPPPPHPHPRGRRGGGRFCAPFADSSPSSRPGFGSSRGPGEFSSIFFRVPLFMFFGCM